MEAPFERRIRSLGQFTYTTTFHIATTNRKFCSSEFAGNVQTFKIFWIVGEISIHFKNEMHNLCQLAHLNPWIYAVPSPSLPFLTSRKSSSEY